MKDDYPPPRVLKDPIPNGVAKGSIVTKKEFKSMLGAYFEARSWTQKGIPTKSKLTKLGLNRVAKDVGAEEEPR